MLESLNRSMRNGNVVGIYVRSFPVKLYLTAVEQIVNNDTVVVKEIDLQGIFHNNNKISIADIDKVHVFNARYEDRLLVSMKKFGQLAEHASLIKIRKRERTIEEGDLRMIAIKNIDSGYRIGIFLQNEFLPRCYIRDYFPPSNEVKISSDIQGTCARCIAVPLITRVDFESFYYYKGLFSKVFHVTRV